VSYRPLGFGERITTAPGVEKVHLRERRHLQLLDE